MKNDVKLASTLVIFYCVARLALESWSLIFAQDPNLKIAAFAENWRLKSSITSAVTVLTGFTLVALVARRQSILRILGLATFSGFCLMNNYATSLDIYFCHPPGDGSLASAAAMWWRLHSFHAWFHIPSILFLATSTILLSTSAFKLQVRRLA